MSFHLGRLIRQNRRLEQVFLLIMVNRDEISDIKLTTFIRRWHVQPYIVISAGKWKKWNQWKLWRAQIDFQAVRHSIEIHSKFFVEFSSKYFAENVRYNVTMQLTERQWSSFGIREDVSNYSVCVDYLQMSFSRLLKRTSLCLTSKSAVLPLTEDSTFWWRA